MPGLRKVSGNQMNIINDSINLPDTSREAPVFYVKREDNLYDVIQNAGGVPFQLIFGDKPGEGEYKYVGEGIKDLLGISPDEFSERKFIEVVRKIVPLDKDLPSDLDEVRSLFLNGKIPNYKAEILVELNGKTKWIRDCSLPVRDEISGKVIGSTGILIEIGGHGNEGDYENKQDESDNLKNSFLRNISHEVRTPLNAIIGFSSLLCEPEQDYSKKKEFADIINANSDHLLEIMDNILEISRLESGAVSVSKKETYPSQLLERIHARYENEARAKNIAIKCIVPDADQAIMTDGFKLFQIMNNLVSNAVKFTLSGSVVFGFKIKDPDLEFFVSDTGIGIEEEYQRKLFDKFFQVESGITRCFPGTGLGLTISKAYADMLGTRIDVVSYIGAGSTFRFRLPL